MKTETSHSCAKTQTWADTTTDTNTELELTEASEERSDRRSLS